LIGFRDAPIRPNVNTARPKSKSADALSIAEVPFMAARKILACVWLIAFAIAAHPAFAENGNDATTTSPSPAPAQRPHKHHSGKHRRQQKQQQAPQTDGSN
jgi:hypothetical protein